MAKPDARRIEEFAHYTSHVLTFYAPQVCGEFWHRCALFIQISGESPVDGEGMTFLSLDTKIPYVHDSPAADAGKAVFYCGRWVNSKGEHGGWGPVASATVAV